MNSSQPTQARRAPDRRRRPGWLRAAAVACLVAGGVVSPVLAAGAASAAPTRTPVANMALTDGQGHGHRGWGDGGSDQRIWGTVTGTTGTGFLLAPSTGSAGQISVQVGPSTRYQEPATPGAGLSGVRTGDVVAVKGANASGTLTAKWVSVPEARLVGAVLQGSTATSLLLTATASDLPGLPAPVTVQLGATTRYDEPGVANPGATAIAVGDVVRVQGAQQGGGQVMALRLQLPLVRAAGLVGSVGTDSFELTATGSTLGEGWPSSALAVPVLTVDVSNSTRFTGRLARSSTGTLPVGVGDRVQVWGTQAGTGTLDALRVVVKGAPEAHSSDGSGTNRHHRGRDGEGGGGNQGGGNQGGGHRHRGSDN